MKISNHISESRKNCILSDYPVNVKALDQYYILFFPFSTDFHKLQLHFVFNYSRPPHPGSAWKTFFHLILDSS